MGLINKYGIYSSLVEKNSEKVHHLKEMAIYDKSVVSKRCDKKINNFIKSKELEINRLEFAILDLNEEVGSRLVSKMRIYNKFDYWARRFIIQRMRLRKYSESSVSKFETRLEKLNKYKWWFESKIKGCLIKKLSKYIVTDEAQKEEIRKNLVSLKESSKVEIEKYTKDIRKIEEEKISAIEEKLSKRIIKPQMNIEKYKEVLKTLKNDEELLDENIVLKVENLTMQFGGLKAVDNLSFEVKKGEIFGLIGPNGAGKTTVFNCITQFYKPTKGKLLFQEKSGNTITLTDYVVHDIVKKGIVRTFQNVEVVKEISVIDNLLVAAHSQYRSSLLTQFLHLPSLKKEELAMRKKAEEVLEFMGLSLYKDWLAWGLPYGILKKIEIARTLMNNPQLIILDEPAAGLNDTETAELTKLIRKIQERYGCTILLVEHDMGLVMDICDTVCAISFGKLLAIGTTEEIQKNKEVQAAYLGTQEEE